MPEIYQIFFSESSKMEKIKIVMGGIATTGIPVLIHGESDTGKELVSQGNYLNSHRSEKPFIGIDCPAIRADLLGSELFVHEKGAFTGVHLERVGKLELAIGQTIHECERRFSNEEDNIILGFPSPFEWDFFNEYLCSPRNHKMARESCRGDILDL